MRADVRHRIDRNRHDLFRRVVRHLLDVHAAFGGGDDRDARTLAVDQHREIELLVDRGAFLDIEAVDLLALRAGLMRDQRAPKNARRFLLDIVDRFHDLDAAGLAAPAGVNLRLDDPYRAAEILRGLLGFGDAHRGEAARHRYAEFRENRFALVLVDVHAAPPSPSCPAKAGHPVRDDRTCRTQPSVFTGSPAFAGDDGKHYFPSVGAILLQASTSVRTAVTDLSNISRSAPLNSSSITRSTPFAPITTGTPTYKSFTPYSPLR